MTLHLLTFNNYYNRQIKVYPTIDEYPGAHAVIEYINFNPNDGVTTEQIINYSGPTPDYLICTDDDNQIVSRWFIIEASRTRAQQYKLSLYRDLVADYLDQILDAPMFVEKASLRPDSPLLFNREEGTFNQIKTTETRLKDETTVPWIVGYYAKNTAAEFLHGVVNTGHQLAFDEALTTSFAAWSFNATENPFYGTATLGYRVYAKSISTDIGSSQVPGHFNFNQYGEYVDFNLRVDNDSGLYVPNYGGYNVGPALQPEFKSRIAQLTSSAETYIPDYNSASTVSNFLKYNGKVVKDNEGRYFSLNIYESGFKEETIDIGAGTLYNLMNTIVKTTGLIKGDANASSFKITARRPEYKMVAQELTDKETTWDLRGDKLLTEDAPYNIFAIPFGTTFLFNGEYVQAISSEQISMATAAAIISTMGENLYDIQLLPYCPISQPATGGVLNIYDINGYSIIKAPGDDTLQNHIGYILNVPRAKFSKNLSYALPAPTSAIETKVSNECDMYRLCSPNYNGSFEFSVAKNKGVDYFNVDCEYKPFQPYIHVYPNFKGLYGRDFGDARGLICGGDFSLTQIEDKWQTYQIQNKNYQEIFNRQIENMEVQHSAQRTQELWGIATGTLSGVAGGGMVGSMFGATPLGLAAGGVASLAGGIADYSINQKLRTEALDYTRDQFGYQLGNIKALPYNLTKVSSFNNNNKLFPFIEYYTCTDIEKEAFRNKLKYNGMSVGVIGTLRAYKQPTETYIKGKLIRLEGVDASFEVFNALSTELNKGVFI